MTGLYIPTGNEIVYVNPVDPNGSLAPILQPTTTGLIAALAGDDTGIINTGIGTNGNGTITAAAIVGNLITRFGVTGANFSDAIDSAANIVTALPAAFAGQSFLIYLKNANPFTETLTTGVGITITGAASVAALSEATYLVTVTSLTAVNFRFISLSPLYSTGIEKATALNTVGAGTITAGGIVSGITVRGGAQSSTPFTDTTDTAAAILLAIGTSVQGQSWEYTYENTTNAPATIQAATGVTVSGITTVNAGGWARYLVTFSAAGTITMVGFMQGSVSALPRTQYSALTNTSGFTLTAAGSEAGAADCTINLTGTLGGDANVQSDIATNIVAAIPNALAGNSYKLRIINSSSANHVWTLTVNTGVTINGTPTMAQNTWRDFYVTLTSLTTVVLQAVGTGTQS